MHVETEKTTLSQLVSVINAEITAGLEQREEYRETPKEQRRELGRFICVRVGGSELAIQLSSVTEAGELSSVRSLPLLPEWLSGIANIRGKIVSVIDLGRFFEYPMPLPAGRQPFIMLSHDSFELIATVEKIRRTRVLYQRSDMQEAKVADLPFCDFVSESAWYEQDGKWNSIPLFNLEQFFSSPKLTGSAD